MGRGAWWATYSPLGCKESDTTEQLSHTANPVSLGAASCLLTSASLEYSSPEMRPWLEQCGKRLFKKVFVEFVIMLLLLFMFWLLAIRPVRS